MMLREPSEWMSAFRNCGRVGHPVTLGNRGIVMAESKSVTKRKAVQQTAPEPTISQTFDEWAEARGIDRSELRTARAAWDAALAGLKADNMLYRAKMGVTGVCHRLHINLRRHPMNIQKALWDVEFLQAALSQWGDSTSVYAERLKDMVLDVIARAAKDSRLVTGKQWTPEEVAVRWKPSPAVD